jgi:hypothetical protein
MGATCTQDFVIDGRMEISVDNYSMGFTEISPSPYQEKA